METSDVNNFPLLAQRDPQQTGVWNRIPSSTTITGGITTVNHTLTSAIQSRAFLLVRGRPSRPVISGDSAFCKNSLNQEFTITFDSSLFTNWTIASGNIVQQNDSVLIVNWGEESNGLVSAFQSDSAGCSSFPASNSVILWDNPVANFVIDVPDLPYEDVPFTLTSLSSGAVGQYWSIANLMNYSDSVIQVVFDAPGVYPVLLQVFNEFGCIDSSSGTIEVIEGMVIPNTFSPNGDGINDELYLINSGVQEFNLKIFDRWGVLVFETNSSKLSWDGKTSSGDRVSAGTYMMVLTAKTTKSSFEKRGALTIFD
jgi:gliding motility-associated-like protein